jgi:hypothetical protein
MDEFTALIGVIGSPLTILGMATFTGLIVVWKGIPAILKLAESINLFADRIEMVADAMKSHEHHLQALHEEIRSGMGTLPGQVAAEIRPYLVEHSKTRDKQRSRFFGIF